MIQYHATYHCYRCQATGTTTVGRQPEPHALFPAAVMGLPEGWHLQHIQGKEWGYFCPDCMVGVKAAYASLRLATAKLNKET